MQHQAVAVNALEFRGICSHSFKVEAIGIFALNNSCEYIGAKVNDQIMLDAQVQFFLLLALILNIGY